MKKEYFLIPVEWVNGVLLFIAVLGIILGIFSFILPGSSIRLYQWIMERFNWKVEPIDRAREARNTRRLGLVLTVLSLAIFLITSRRF